MFATASVFLRTRVFAPRNTSWPLEPYGRGRAGMGGPVGRCKHGPGDVRGDPWSKGLRTFRPSFSLFSIFTPSWFITLPSLLRCTGSPRTSGHVSSLRSDDEREDGADGKRYLATRERETRDRSPVSTGRYRDSSDQVTGQVPVGYYPNKSHFSLEVGETHRNGIQ